MPHLGSGIVTVSMNINTRQVVLMIDNVLIPAKDVSIDRFTSFDGEEVASFSYSLESAGENGIIERRQFFLPSLASIASNSHAELDKHGMESKVVHDDSKAKADVIDYINAGRKKP